MNRFFRLFFFKVAVLLERSSGINWHKGLRGVITKSTKGCFAIHKENVQILSKSAKVSNMRGFYEFRAILHCT